MFKKIVNKVSQILVLEKIKKYRKKVRADTNSRLIKFVQAKKYQAEAK